MPNIFFEVSLAFFEVSKLFSILADQIAQMYYKASTTEPAADQNFSICFCRTNNNWLQGRKKEKVWKLFLCQRIMNYLSFFWFLFAFKWDNKANQSLQYRDFQILKQSFYWQTTAQPTRGGAKGHSSNTNTTKG